MTMMRSDAKREGEWGVREEKSQCLSFSVLIVFLFHCLNSCYLLTQLGIFSFVFFVVVHRYHGYVWRASGRNMIWNKKHREWRFGGQESVFLLLKASCIKVSRVCSILPPYGLNYSKQISRCFCLVNLRL